MLKRLTSVLTLITWAILGAAIPREQWIIEESNPKPHGCCPRARTLSTTVQPSDETVTGDKPSPKGFPYWQYSQ